MSDDPLVNEKRGQTLGEEKSPPVNEYFRANGISSKVRGLLLDIEASSAHEKRYTTHEI